MLKPIKIGEKLFDWENGPFFMGILNVTPDSFSDGGQFLHPEKAIKRAIELAEEGADIIDIGGESTRPFAEPVTVEEELKRVIPVIKAIREALPQIPISIDTYKSAVAEAALKAGANMVNDISAGRFDERMFHVVKEFDCPIVIMHMKGKPKNMQIDPVYHNVISEIKEFFEKRIESLTRIGVEQSKIIIDPGIGFGKKLEHNIEILRNIEKFKELGCPILVGHSRKRFLSNFVNRPPEERDGATVGVSLGLILKGVNILRVHRVDLNKDAAILFKNIFGKVRLN